MLVYNCNIYRILISLRLVFNVTTIYIYLFTNHVDDSFPFFIPNGRTFIWKYLYRNVETLYLLKEFTHNHLNVNIANRSLFLTLHYICPLIYVFWLTTGGPQAFLILKSVSILVYIVMFDLLNTNILSIAVTVVPLL